MRTLGSRYVLHERLGQGTTGEVWRGEHIPSGEPVAIKVLRPELADDPTVVDRFLREWELLAELDSPDLVQVRDLINEPDTLAIVMDLVEGIDLRAHLERSGPRPVSEAVRLVVGVLWALDSVHAAGIIHRDVKPENILIDTSDPQQPFVRLTDFGIARMIHTPGRASVTGPIGTPLYMAPELASGAPPTPAVDVYAAGVVLYELLAGSPPFDAAHPADLLRAHREDPPEPIHGVPPAVWDVLAAMLAKSPRNRPASAADAAEDLIEALDRVQGHAQASQAHGNGHPRQDGGYRDGGRAPAHDVAFDAAHTQITSLDAIKDWNGEHTDELAVRRGGQPSPSTTGTTRLAGMAGAGTVAMNGDWNDVESTQIAGMAPITDGWSDPEATGIAPGVRVPARSAGTASDRNTVISAIPANRQPTPGSSSGGGPAADRRRRGRIAAGAGLVVALLAAAGGLALANAGGDDNSLTGDGPAQVTVDRSGTPMTPLPGGQPAVVPGEVSPTATAAGAATTRPSASSSPGQSQSADPSPDPGQTTAPPDTSASPSPTPTGAPVPDVTGDTLSTAQSTLSGAGFTNVTSSEVCEGSSSNNTVVKQSPAAGTTATKTTRITLSVQNCRQVPSVAGSSIAAAESAIRNAGLNPLQGSGGCQWGTLSTVASTNPGAGTRLAAGAGVWIEPNCKASPPPAPPPPTSTGGGSGSGS